MWTDSSGYFFAQHIPESDLVLEVPSKKNISLKKDPVFINEGGTIVSTPFGCTGVKPVYDLIGKDLLLKNYVEKENMSYVDDIVKLSEKWNTKDYFKFKKNLKKLSLSHSSFIITYGTDYISFFAPWVDILCKEFNIKAIIIIGQRSWDRPTSQFIPLFRDSINALKKLKKKNCMVLTHNGLESIVHSPYQIKKFHTTSKNGFYSRHQIKLKYLKNFKQFKFKSCVKSIDFNKKLITPSIHFENPFMIKNADLLVSRGVGNPKTKPNKFHSTIVGSGPTCEYLYSGVPVSQLSTKNMDFTWESLYIILTLTKHENRS